MFKAFGNYVDRYPELRGVNPIFTGTLSPLITDDYPKDNDVIDSLKKAASIHKEVRRFLQPYLRPGIKLIDIAKLIELKTIELSNQSKSINKGIGFPVGLSINECAAHYHPDPKDNTILNSNDIIKIDFGTEVNGWIIDSAFTVCFDSKYDNLMTAVKEATETGIKNIGIDGDIGDWGKSIQEVMESYEITLNGKTLPIKAINNLGGHNIVKGIIHGGMFLPSVDMKKTLPPNYRFKEGVYAVETFGSTGANTVTEIGDSTLYRINPTNTSTSTLKLATTKNLYNKIYENFKTLPFTDRYIDTFNINNYKSHLKLLSNNNLIHSYPPLCVGMGDYTAQYEHTIYIGDGNKIVFSRGEDY
jgi:methionyl aminopeptidase